MDENLIINMFDNVELFLDIFLLYSYGFWECVCNVYFLYMLKERYVV